MLYFVYNQTTQHLINHVIFRRQSNNTMDTMGQTKSEKETDVMEEFFRNVRLKIIRNKEAHLLHNLLAYVNDLSEPYGIPAGVEHT